MGLLTGALSSVAGAVSQLKGDMTGDSILGKSDNGRTQDMSRLFAQAPDNDTAIDSSNVDDKSKTAKLNLIKNSNLKNFVSPIRETHDKVFEFRDKLKSNILGNTFGGNNEQ